MFCRCGAKLLGLRTGSAYQSSKRLKGQTKYHEPCLGARLIMPEPAQNCTRRRLLCCTRALRPAALLWAALAGWLFRLWGSWGGLRVSRSMCRCSLCSSEGGGGGGVRPASPGLGMGDAFGAGPQAKRLAGRLVPRGLRRGQRFAAAMQRCHQERGAEWGVAAGPGDVGHGDLGCGQLQCWDHRPGPVPVLAPLLADLGRHAGLPGVAHRRLLRRRRQRLPRTVAGHGEAAAGDGRSEFAPKPHLLQLCHHGVCRELSV